MIQTLFSHCQMKQIPAMLMALALLIPAISCAAGEELMLSKIIAPPTVKTFAASRGSDGSDIDAAANALNSIKKNMSDYYRSERDVKLAFGESYENIMLNNSAAIFTYNVLRGDMHTLLSIAIKRVAETLRFNCILWDNPDEYGSKSKEQLAATFKKHHFDLGPTQNSEHPAEPIPAKEDLTTEMAEKRSEPTSVNSKSVYDPSLPVHDAGTAGNKSFFMFQRH